MLLLFVHRIAAVVGIVSLSLVHRTRLGLLARDRVMLQGTIQQTRDGRISDRDRTYELGHMSDTARISR
jgi:hypothetical protein